MLSALLTTAAAVYGCSTEGSTRTEDQKLTLQGKLGRTPGGTVAVSGDTLVVASPFRSNGAVGSGATYVFERVDGDWSFTQELSRDDDDIATDDQFGSAVSLTGDTIVVGAAGKRRGVSLNHQGAAYVFVRRHHKWSLQQKLLAPEGELVIGFGKAVGVSGDTAIVGATNEYSDDAFHPAAAYVFSRSDDTWSLQQELTGSTNPKETDFGYSVALGVDTAIVGAPSEMLDGDTPQGAAYVYVRVGNTWSLQQRLSGKANSLGADFGIAVAVDGRTLVVGEDLSPGSDQGVAYVYTRSGESWSRQQKLMSSDGTSGGAFGIAAALSGDTIVVGAAEQPVDGSSGPGAAYVFVRSGGVFKEHSKLVAHDGHSADQFGRSVAVEAHTVIVGATAYEGHEGAAYVFDGEP